MKWADKKNIDQDYIKPQLVDGHRWVVSDFNVKERNVDNWIIEFIESCVEDGGVKSMPLILER
jgi:hypothetical protein